MSLSADEVRFVTGNGWTRGRSIRFVGLFAVEKRGLDGVDVETRRLFGGLFWALR